jgi:hypothetical protein
MPTADNTGLALPNPADILIDIQTIVWTIANMPHHDPHQYLRSAIQTESEHWCYQYCEDVGAWTNTRSD